MSSEGEVIKVSLENEAEWKIEWTIEEIFSLMEEKADFNSPYFTVPGSKWYLKICNDQCNAEEDSCDRISLFLFPAKDQKFPISINYTFGVKKADDSVKEIVIDDSWDFVNSEGIGCREFLMRSELLRNISELAPFGILTVICFLQVNNLDYTSRLDKLSENFKDLFISKNFCDVTLKVQNEEFPAHKCILASRCVVFAVMFETDMKEKNTGIVNIQDCDSGAFKDFLTYLYSGKSVISVDKAFNLYRIAHKYDVQELKTDCVSFIQNNLSLENLYDAVILGEQFDEDGVKMEAQKFFIEYFREIVSTTEWELFLKNNWRLSNELLNILVTDMISKK